MRDMYECDLCSKVIRERHWYDYARPMHLAVYVSCQNPLGPITGNHQASELKLGDVCDPCRRHVAQAIAVALQERRPTPTPREKGRERDDNG